jgi:hypothetical protein
MPFTRATLEPKAGHFGTFSCILLPFERLVLARFFLYKLHSISSLR